MLILQIFFCVLINQLKTDELDIGISETDSDDDTGNDTEDDELPTHRDTHEEYGLSLSVQK